MIFRLMVLLCVTFSAALFAQPDVQLAKRYAEKRGDYPVTDYLVSEKYDGVRGIWTGSELLSRAGNPIHAPAWFTEKLPDVWLDGELWSKRGDFEFAAAVVAKDTPIDREWHQMHYMVFDAPDYKHTFLERSQRYTKVVQQLNLPFVIAIKQFTVANNKALSDALARYVAKGSEGLVLHRKVAMFESGRTGNLLKLKPYMDDEATVVGLTEGEGKYSGMMGALIVEMPSGVKFKIGTGFSDEERNNPPNVGDVITYKYHGFTSSGIPRFASFLRVRYPVGVNSAL